MSWLDAELRSVIVVSIHDGLLVKAWSKGTTWPAEDVTPYVADLCLRAAKLIETAAAGGPLRGLTLELDDELVLLREVWPGYAGTFVFPSQTPLGLARMEIGRAMPDLRRAVWQLDPAGFAGSPT